LFAVSAEGDRFNFSLMAFQRLDVIAAYTPDFNAAITAGRHQEGIVAANGHIFSVIFLGITIGIE